MTINELWQFSLFRKADIYAIDEEHREIIPSPDDEIVDITDIVTGYVPVKRRIFSYPRRFIRVHCVVKHVKETYGIVEDTK